MLYASRGAIKYGNKWLSSGCIQVTRSSEYPLDSVKPTQIPGTSYLVSVY